MAAIEEDEEEEVEVPPPPSTATKGHLRKRLRDTIHVSVATSTTDLEKTVPPTSTTAVKKKKKKTEVITVDAATRAFARVVWRDIEQVVKRRRHGCSMNLMGQHDVCGTPKAA